jgi:hypothetical protein
MISQVVVTRSTAPQQVELAEDVKRGRLEVRRDANRLLKNVTLPPQRSNNISSDGLYLPAFPTQESKWLTRTTHNRMVNKEGATFVGLLVGAMGITMGIGFGVTESLAMGLMAGGSLGSISGGMLLSRKLVTKNRLTLKERMADTAFESFVAWAKNRYDITVARSSLSHYAEQLITSGYRVDEMISAYSYVTDEVTGIKYAVCVRPSNEIYLSPYGSPDVEASLAAHGASTPPLMVGSLSSPTNLPDEASALHEQLMASVALLKTQELSVEMAHQIERTESVVGVVLAKYASIAKLKATEKARQDLVGFLQNQVEFVDGLIDQHADELTKEMSVEIAAVTAAEKNSLLLEVKR